jgi:hypothetical protein
MLSELSKFATTCVLGLPIAKFTSNAGKKNLAHVEKKKYCGDPRTPPRDSACPPRTVKTYSCGSPRMLF